MIIPKKIAEWLERAKEDGVDYEVNKLRVLVFDDTEILEVIGDTYKECGINQSNISYCLINHGGYGIGYWMKTTPDSFEIICMALTKGYEISGSMDDDMQGM